jgi:hypothetical protein
MGVVRCLYGPRVPVPLGVINITRTDFDSLAFSPFLTNFGLRLGWFPVCVKQWLNHCMCSTAVSSAKVAVVDSGVVGRSAICSKNNNYSSPSHLP